MRGTTACGASGFGTIRIATLEDFEVSKILVTGAAGFIGSQFVELLLGARDSEVVVLDKLTYAGNKKDSRRCGRISTISKGR